MSTETGLGHYASVLRHWLWLIGLSIGVCGGSTYAVNTFTSPVYEASALIQVHDTGTINNNIFTDQALAQSCTLLINRPAVLRAVVQRMPGLTVHQLESSVSDSPLDNTPIIQVRATAKDPALAATIANTVVDVFIKLQVDDETTRLKGVATKLYKNLTLAKQNIYADQAQLVALQDAHASQDRIAHQDDVLSSDQVSYNSSLMNYDRVQQQLFQISNILTIAQVAISPTLPSSPRTVLNTAVAAVLSALTVIVLVLLLDWIDTSIKTSDDVEQIARINSLGSIPFCKSAHSSNLPIVNINMIERSFDRIGVTTSILARKSRSILMTGIHKGDGTSTVAANLAITLARSGLRVLLVDANLHDPSLHKIFKSPNTSGLTTVFSEMNLFRDGMETQIHSWLNPLSTYIPNLYFLPSGPKLVDMTTSALFFSSTIRLLQDRLLQLNAATHYGVPSRLVDIILFDSASLESSADTLALASSIETCILIINAGQEQATTLHKTSAILHKLSCNLLGVIINRQKLKHKSYFYTHRYHKFTPSEDTTFDTKTLSPTTFQSTPGSRSSHAPLAPSDTSVYNQPFNHIFTMPHSEQNLSK
ncbi:MAG: hypothetical protein NVSMB44_02770 [Ktedonobacteraceae bacterium]